MQINGDIGNLLKKGLTDATNSFSAYLIALGVISALTMALLQALKDMTPLRKWYNQAMLNRWLTERATELIQKKKPTRDEPSVLETEEYDPAAERAAELERTRQQERAAELKARGEREKMVCMVVTDAKCELLKLAADGETSSFYGAELETLCTQFSGAALLVMDYPTLSEDLFKLLTVHAKDEDVRLLLSAAPVFPIPTLATQHQDPIELSAAAQTRHELVEARNRIRHQLTQSIASFQLSTGSRWQFWLKVASLVISTLLALIAFALSGQADRNDVGLLLFTAVISGFLAPIARDLLAALQKLRG